MKIQFPLFLIVNFDIKLQNIIPDEIYILNMNLLSFNCKLNPQLLIMDQKAKKFILSVEFLNYELNVI